MLRLVHEKKKAIEKYRKEDFGEHEKVAVVLPRSNKANQKWHCQFSIRYVTKIK